MSFPDPESLMGDTLTDFVAADAFGQTLTVYTDTYDGRHPQEGTPQWTEDTTGTEVSGRVEEASQSEEQQRTTGDELQGEFDIYVPNTAPVQDGRGDEAERASTVVDEAGVEYAIELVVDQGNGLYRCVGDIQ